MTDQRSVVLIIGSGPNAAVVADWPRSPFSDLICINNAWRLRPDWDFTIYPEDFPADRKPSRMKAGQKVVTAADYVPVQNRQGGFVYAGGTMAFTAGYWALGALRPAVIAFIGCDMVYPTNGKTHFYGTGAPDPLRKDPTLQSLEAKSARLFLLAAEQGCACVNLSSDASRLVMPRSAPQEVASARVSPPTPEQLDRPRKAEAELGYFVPSGRYWEEADAFDSKALAKIDTLWLDAYRASTAELCDERNALSPACTAENYV